MLRKLALAAVAAVLVTVASASAGDLGVQDAPVAEAKISAPAACEVTTPTSTVGLVVQRGTTIVVVDIGAATPGDVLTHVRISGLNRMCAGASPAGDVSLVTTSGSLVAAGQALPPTIHDGLPLVFLEVTPAGIVADDVTAGSVGPPTAPVASWPVLDQASADALVASLSP